MQPDLFRGPRHWRDRRSRPTSAVQPPDPQAARMLLPQGTIASLPAPAPAAPVAEVSRKPEPAGWRHGPRLVAGGGVCEQCQVPYVEHYWDTERYIAENAALFARGENIETARHRHQALLAIRGAVECQWHCGYALVPPHGKSGRDDGERECDAAGEQTEDPGDERGD